MNKKIPLRMCIVCRGKKPKSEVIRVVKTPDDEYVVDTTGKINGRGAYVCKNSVCMEKCLKTRALNRAFRQNIEENVYSRIKENIVEDK